MNLWLCDKLEFKSSHFKSSQVIQIGGRVCGVREHCMHM